MKTTAKPTRQKLAQSILIKHPITQIPVEVPYTLIVSPRARRLSMRVGVEKGLEVVVPRRFSLANVPRFMHEHSSWVITNMQKRQIKKREAASNQIKEGSILTILGDQKTIRIHPTRKAKPFIKEARSLKYDAQTAYYDNEEILIYLPSALLSGIDSNPQEINSQAKKINAQALNPQTQNLAPEALKLAKQTLEKHLRLKAKKIFTARTAEIAGQMGLSYNRVTIKAQKTRWGSCSRDKNLNFNWRLILTDNEIMDSIIIHELAHLVHLNHGKRFYNLVEQYCPNHKRLSNKLKDMVFVV